MSADRPTDSDRDRAAAVELRFYTRDGCHLCDVAYAELAPVADDLGVPIEVIDIDADASLRARWGTLIPVVTIDGNRVFTYRVDAAQARAHLERAIRRRGREAS